MKPEPRRTPPDAIGVVSSHDGPPRSLPTRRSADDFVTVDFTRDWEACAASVVRSLMWQGFDRSLAEDVTQEAGARYLEGRAARSNITTTTEFRRWLYVVARNLAIDFQRRATAAATKLPMAIPAPSA